jgi:GGDEF domain-containing protein
MLTSLLIATLINVAFNFRAHAIKSATDKAKMTASIVKDALTSHMVNGIMDKRHNSTKDSACEIAKKIQDDFNNTKFNVGSKTIQKTISIGVAEFPDDANSIWKVIKYADTALYEAKNTGRNKVVHFKTDMFSYEDKEG